MLQRPSRTRATCPTASCRRGQRCHGVLTRPPTGDATAGAKMWHALEHERPLTGRKPVEKGPRSSASVASARRPLDPPGRRRQRRPLPHRRAGRRAAGAAAARLPAVLVDLAAPAAPALADAGFRAVAMDLRGASAAATGRRAATTRPTSPSTSPAVIRSLGEPDAALVGHDLGGYLAWTAAAMRPQAGAAGSRSASMPHPRRWRSAMLSDVQQTPGGLLHLGRSSARGCPERQLTADDGGAGRPADPRLVGAAPPGRRGGGRRTGARCASPRRRTARVEPYRWMVRSMARPDGIQFYRRMKRPVRVPTRCICTVRSTR